MLIDADPGRRDQAVVLKPGDKVVGADVVVTQGDGSVAIRLDHNGALWNLGPDRRVKVSESAAWTALPDKGARLVSGKTERDRTAAAGRHAERQAANTAATAVEGSSERAAPESQNLSNADLPERAGASRPGSDEERELRDPESKRASAAPPSPRNARPGRSRDDSPTGNVTEEDEDSSEADETRALRAANAAPDPEQEAPREAPRDESSGGGSPEKSDRKASASDHLAKNAEAKTVAADSAGPLALGTTRVLDSAGKTRSAPPAPEALRRALKRRLRDMVTCVGNRGPETRAVLTVEVRVAANGTISNLEAVGGPRSLKRCAAEVLQKAIGVDVGRGPYRAEQTLIWSGKSR